ncbi:uncharacterized protein LOC116434746 isoform X1 [Nomia melanderi]|uniref:uncharacterized protein LOC116434746 isoform X1 n=1 Tax=Nomia melanderi TaxID=2448451 RepID=UPI003FCD54B8
MAKLLHLCYFTVAILEIPILFLQGVWGQENAVRNLSPSLHECYDNKFILQRDNRLPHTINTFISILRKIENSEGLNMDLRSLSVALLHRFRQDGITANPDVPALDGVTPYAPNDLQFYRHARTLGFIPGNALHFPNNSITNIERCTLHFMLSSSIETLQRGDEAKVCRYSSLYRHARNIKHTDEPTSKDTINDAETLTSDELKTMTNQKDGGAKVTDDPSSLYPALPPNHPDNGKMIGSMTSAPQSKCPVENGVIKTPWGVVSPGLVLSAVAAATQPEIIKLQDIQPNLVQANNPQLSGLTIDNIWFATLAGDLAEVALTRGPLGKISVGGIGHWNSTALPRWYFLDSNDTLEMTTAEIRGDIDGLILANEINKWYSRIPSLKLSQIFDMYYSTQGLFDSSIRACNRRTLFTSVAPNETMSAQAYSAAVLLNPDIATATLDPIKIKEFSVQAVNDLARYVPSSMNDDLSCTDTDKLNDSNKAYVDLTIILDTNWPFSAIQSILATLLESIDLNQFNSNFTLINGYDGSVIINSTYNILEFYAYNSSHYDNITHGFDLPKSIDKLWYYSRSKLENERNKGIGGARSDVVLIIPYISTISISDKDYCLQNIVRMREQIPDTTLLIMAYGSKDMWSDLVKNPTSDLFTISIGDTMEALSPVITLVSRIKQVPKRLINTQCGENYKSNGSSNPYVDQVAPNEIKLYSLHPNYFFKHEGYATVKIQGSNLDNLNVCWAREPLDVKTQNVSSKTCASVAADVYDIKVSCADATFIHKCPPLYMSVATNATSVSSLCTARECRYPNSVKYTISYEDLVCVSSASKFAASSLVLLVLLIFFHV